MPGSLGVTIFFFISGFLITTLLIREQEAAGAINLRHFYLRRYLRILPEALAYIAVAGLLSMLFFHSLRAIDLFGAVFYFTNYLDIFNPISGAPMPLGHFWSLSIEEHFYLTWPFAFILARGDERKLVKFLVFVVIACTAVRLLATANGANVSYLRYASESRFDSIAYGCLFAFLYRRKKGKMDIHPLANNALFFGGAAIMACSTYAGIFNVAPWIIEVFVYQGQGLGIFMIFMFLFLSRERVWGETILELKPVSWVGRHSYGMYLWHYAVIYGVVAVLGKSAPSQLTLSGQVLTFFLATIVSALAGYLSYALLLAPLNSFRKRLRHEATSPHQSAAFGGQGAT